MVNLSQLLPGDWPGEEYDGRMRLDDSDNDTTDPTILEDDEDTRD